MNCLLAMNFVTILFFIHYACNAPIERTETHGKGLPHPTLVAPASGDSRLATIRLPPGFTIEVYAEDLENARSMELTPAGTLFVGTRGKGNVYALQDEDRDFKAEKRWTIASGLHMPNGVAFRDGDLYLAEVSRIWRFPNIESHLEKPVKEILVDTYPDKDHHGWKYIAFGPDGHLYVPVGAPCNICESADEIFATITRINLSTKRREIVHRGIRNTVGFDWHPVTKELWFSDNGGDWLGDDMPACEINHAPKDGMHFGFPYCHQGDFPDPKLGKKGDCEMYTPPARKLGAHVAPLGIEFYTGTMFPETYHHQLFVAEHGSWNRSIPVGYRVMLVRIDGDKVTSYEPFADGWLQNGKVLGRPVDIELLPDGSMLVSDDYANKIYRISYSG